MNMISEKNCRSSDMRITNMNVTERFGIIDDLTRLKFKHIFKFKYSKHDEDEETDRKEEFVFGSYKSDFEEAKQDALDKLAVFCFKDKECRELVQTYINLFSLYTEGTDYEFAIIKIPYEDYISCKCEVSEEEEVNVYELYLYLEKDCWKIEDITDNPLKLLSKS